MKRNCTNMVLFSAAILLLWSCSNDDAPEPKVYTPFISGFSPESQYVGEEIVLSGVDFGTNVSKNKVMFGDVEAKIRMASAQKIWVEVPESALTNKITVEAYGKKVVTATDFIVLTTIFLDEERLDLTVSENRTLIASVFGYDGETTVSWSSDNESVVTVDQEGNVTAIGAGTATVTAIVVEDTGATVDCIITVKPNA